MSGIEALMGRGSSGSSQIEQPDDAQGKSIEELNQEDFFNLMIEQFQNQDPFEPMDSEKVMGQMTQFTTANGVSELQKSFEEFANKMTQDQALRAGSLVGRDVLVESDTMRLNESGLSGVAELSENTGNLSIEIQDSAGQTVRTMDMGQQDSGDVPFQWNGISDDGEQLPPGDYQVKARAGSGDNATAVDTLASAQVNSVSLEGDGKSPRLNLAGVGEVSLDSVRQIQ